MMNIVVYRGQVIDNIVTQIKDNIIEGNVKFALVKPYEGEIDRFSKKETIKDPRFMADTSLQTPFALVVSKRRKRDPINSSPGRLVALHEISIYVGAARQMVAGSTSPEVWELLGRLARILHEFNPHPQWGGPLKLDDEGERLERTDVYNIYDQKYLRIEPLFY